MSLDAERTIKQNKITDLQHKINCLKKDIAIMNAAESLCDYAHHLLRRFVAKKYNTLIDYRVVWKSKDKMMVILKELKDQYEVRFHVEVVFTQGAIRYSNYANVNLKEKPIPELILINTHDLASCIKTRSQPNSLHSVQADIAYWIVNTCLVLATHQKKP